MLGPASKRKRQKRKKKRTQKSKSQENCTEANGGYREEIL